MSQSTALLQNTLTAQTTICGHAVVTCFGILGGTNWIVDRDRPETFDQVFDALPSKVKTIWMPVPSQSTGQIAERYSFYEEAAKGGVSLMGKVHADGVRLFTDEAFAITSADCPTVVMYNTSKTHTVCFHASRDSLFDKKYLLTGTRGRKNFSVLESALQVFTDHNIPLEDIRLHIFCGIRRGFIHPPNDPNHGDYNKNLLQCCHNYKAVLDEECGEIDLHTVIRAQAIIKGIRAENVHFDDIDTHEDTLDGKFCWASARRDLPKKRNLVLVYM